MVIGALDFELFFILLVVYQVKHYIADFPLQKEYMVKNKALEGWAFVRPLAIHCGIHAFLSLLIVMAVNPTLWWLALVDFATHFTMDRIKAGPRYLGRFNDPTTSAFWNCLGFDQMVHHITHYFIILQLALH